MVPLTSTGMEVNSLTPAGRNGKSVGVAPVSVTALIAWLSMPNATSPLPKSGHADVSTGLPTFTPAEDQPAAGAPLLAFTPKTLLAAFVK